MTVNYFYARGSAPGPRPCGVLLQGDVVFNKSFYTRGSAPGPLPCGELFQGDGVLKIIIVMPGAQLNQAQQVIDSAGY